LQTCRALRDAVVAASTYVQLSLSKDQQPAHITAHQGLLRRVGTSGSQGLQLELRAPNYRLPPSGDKLLDNLLEKLLKAFQAEGLPNVPTLFVRVRRCQSP
jgi:hypothetical protein